MHADPQDTIVALSTAPGPGARAVVRLSGPAALAVASALFTPGLAAQRRIFPGTLRLPAVPDLPAVVYVFPEPHSYTGQDVVEIHTLSSPPLVELLIARLLHAGARAAQPGEFTMRAFLSGKLDLTRAEAVLGVIEAGDRVELKQALAQLAGNVARPLQELRDDLLNLLADVEAALDFADEDIHFVNQDELLHRVARGLAIVTHVQKQLTQRAVSGRCYRVVLTGRPNAGKSSLFNALTGAAALVSPVPGTTRDYLVRRVELDGVPVELVDTAGQKAAADATEEQAQAFGKKQEEQADLVLLCIDAHESPTDEERQRLKADAVLGVATKGDLAAPQEAGRVTTSVVTGAGLDQLKEILSARAKARRQPALAPSLSRCQHHVNACVENLRRAHSVVLYEDPPEILALELRETLDQIGALVGAIYTDDLLDRIFSRFCIGK